MFTSSDTIYQDSGKGWFIWKIPGKSSQNIRLGTRQHFEETLKGAPKNQSCQKFHNMESSATLSTGLSTVTAYPQFFWEKKRFFGEKQRFFGEESRCFGEDCRFLGEKNRFFGEASSDISIANQWVALSLPC